MLGLPSTSCHSLTRLALMAQILFNTNCAVEQVVHLAVHAELFSRTLQTRTLPLGKFDSEHSLQSTPFSLYLQVFL